MDNYISCGTLFHPAILYADYAGLLHHQAISSLIAFFSTKECIGDEDAAMENVDQGVPGIYQRNLLLYGANPAQEAL